MKVIVQEENHKQRIDKVLSNELTDLSRTRIIDLIEQGNIIVNGKEVKKNYKCSENDVIEITIPASVDSEIVPEDIPLEIVYEDEHLLVVNKPRGMVVHPSPGHTSKTLVNALMFHCKDQLSGINGEIRPGIVHRIDKDTSGLLVVAKNDKAHQGLTEQLKDKKPMRKYYALVEGNINHSQGKINAPIGRSKSNRIKYEVTAFNSKEAVTHFKVVEHISEYTLIECQLETGRTHQIRVHMNYINHPIVGDPLYGRKKSIVQDGQILHAKSLGFTHPITDEYMEFDSELQKYFVDAMELAKNNL